jgi:hypothetical protein
MAVSGVAGPHTATLIVNGSQFLIEHGSVDQNSTRQSSTFSVSIPMNSQGALQTLAKLGANTASVIVSTRGQQNTLITGEIDVVVIDLIGTSIQVIGRCVSSKLHNVKSSEKWVNKKGHEIVQDLAGRVGLQVTADESMLQAGKQVQIDYAKMTDGISYASVIHKLAELDGARWWVDHQGQLHYQSKTNPSGTYTINYSYGPPIVSDAIRLSIRHNVQAGKKIQVQVRSWNPKKKEVLSADSNVSGEGGPLSYKYHIPNLLKDHVTQHAKSKANEQARHAWQINASLAGDPSIDVAMGLQLTGTNYFDQIYEIDSIHHEFGMSGHTMEIDAKTAGSGRNAS